MSNRNRNIFVFGFISMCSLVIGLLIYLIFRENTYISKFVLSHINISLLRDAFYPIENNFLKYYFVDYLWGLSLSCGLHVILLPKIKQSFNITIVVFIIGALYEGFQKIDIIGGTGDITDMFLYLLAGLTVNLINFILIKKEEKKK